MPAIIGRKTRFDTLCLMARKKGARLTRVGPGWNAPLGVRYHVTWDTANIVDCATLDEVQAALERDATTK